MAYHSGKENFNTMRNQPYINNGYYGYAPAMPEYQKSRPAKLNSRLLDRKFKKVTIQLNDNKVLVISVQTLKNKQPYLVFSQCEGSYENTTDTVSVPETLVVPFVQQLHKLSKWRPSTSGYTPSGQGLTADDTVFRTQIVNLSDADTQLEARQYAIKICAVARAKDPSLRKELGNVLIPLETNHLIKVKEALNDALVAAVESPLYFSKSLQGTDGSRFYLDLIKDNRSHYLKISQVTRDFRSILHLPADDLDALKTDLEACLQAMKGTEEQKAKKKRNKPGRKKNRRQDWKKASQSSEANDKQDKDKNTETEKNEGNENEQQVEKETEEKKDVEVKEEKVKVEEKQHEQEEKVKVEEKQDEKEEKVEKIEVKKEETVEQVKMEKVEEKVEKEKETQEESAQSAKPGDSTEKVEE